MLDVLRLSKKKKKRLLTFLANALTPYYIKFQICSSSSAAYQVKFFLLHYPFIPLLTMEKTSLNIAAPTVSKSSIIRVKLLQIFPSPSMK